MRSVRFVECRGLRAPELTKEGAASARTLVLEPRTGDGEEFTRLPEIAGSCELGTEPELVRGVCER